MTSKPRVRVYVGVNQHLRAVKRRPPPARPPRKPRGQRKPSRSATLDASAVLERLRQHALGAAPMTSTQVRAAEVVLKKAQAADRSKSRAVRPIISAEPLSEDEWQQLYAR
jgi:hypothetical protein